VEATLTRNTAGAAIVHLVNTSADLSRPVERVVPVSGGELEVRVGDGASWKARALFLDRELPFAVRGGIAHLSLPILNEYEVIAIERADPKG
jgi:hypothetical protein